MADLTVKIDVDAPVRMISRAIRALEPPNATRAVRDGARVLQGGVRARALHRTGRLRGSFEVRTTGPYEAQVGSDLIYAPVHEYGAVIRPVRRQYLRFTVGGRVVFTRGPVTIPARPYVEPTLLADGDRAAAAVADRVLGAI